MWLSPIFRNILSTYEVCPAYNLLRNILCNGNILVISEVYLAFFNTDLKGYLHTCEIGYHDCFKENDFTTAKFTYGYLSTFLRI